MFNNYTDTIVQKYFTYIGTATIQTAILCIIAPIVCEIDIAPYFVLYVLCLTISTAIFYYMHSIFYGSYEYCNIILGNKKFSIERYKKYLKIVESHNLLMALIIGYISINIIRYKCNGNYYRGILVSMNCIISAGIVKLLADRYVKNTITKYITRLAITEQAETNISNTWEKRRIVIVRSLITIIEVIICTVPFILMAENFIKHL